VTINTLPKRATRKYDNVVDDNSLPLNNIIAIIVKMIEINCTIIMSIMTLRGGFITFSEEVEKPYGK
tara:strand:- start:7194 stop:7394 length:201 start_codon:yes stop_codon:yes gene_type:complete